MAWRFALIIGLASSVINAGCGSAERGIATTDPDGPVGTTEEPVVPTEGATAGTTSAPGITAPSSTTVASTAQPTVTPNDIVRMFADTVAVPVGRFRMVAPQTLGPSGFTATHAGEYDQAGEGVWLTLEISDATNPEMLGEMAEIVDITTLVVLDGESVFTCVDDRDPLWMGGPRAEWQHVADAANVYSDSDAGPFPWAEAFDLLIANPDLIVGAERQGRAGGETVYRVVVLPEAVGPVVATASTLNAVGDSHLDLGDPVELTVTADDSGFITSIAFSADEVSRALLVEASGSDIPAGMVGYAHTLTLKRLGGMEMPVVDTSAGSCPDQIHATAP